MHNMSFRVTIEESLLKEIFRWRSIGRQGWGCRATLAMNFLFCLNSH